MTESKKAEQACVESESLLREVIDTIDKAIAIYEAVDEGDDFLFQGMNKAAEPIDWPRFVPA